MSISRRTTASILGLVITAFAVILYSLFHGFFDHGQFVLEQVESSPSKQVAMVARRSDDEPLDGDVYFVLIGEHVFSPTELRRAYYSEKVIFATSNSCVRLRWQGAAALDVSCSNSVITPKQIDSQSRQSGRVSIWYEDIPAR